jgi:hypothetical protein
MDQPTSAGVPPHSDRGVASRSEAGGGLMPTPEPAELAVNERRRPAAATGIRGAGPGRRDADRDARHNNETAPEPDHQTAAARARHSTLDDSHQLPVWSTRRGDVPLGRLLALIQSRGVRINRARIIYWQSVGLFPHPETRFFGWCGGSTGFYHRGAIELAVLVDRCLAHDLPYRPSGSRSSVRPLAGALARWRDSDGDELATEERFYGTVRRELSRLRHGRDPRLIVASVAPGVPAKPSRPSASPNRWRVTSGSISALEFDRRCRAVGVAMSRGRRTYWQRLGLLPLGARTSSAATCSAERRGRHTYFPPACIDLALVIDYFLDPEHPVKSTRWSAPPTGLADVLHVVRSTKAEGDDGHGCDAALFALISRMATDLRTGRRPTAPPGFPRTRFWDRLEVPRPAAERPGSDARVARSTSPSGYHWWREFPSDPPDSVVA